RNDEGEDVVVESSGQQVRFGNCLNTVVSTGKIGPLDGDSPDKLGKRQSKHGKIDVRQAQAQCPQHYGQSNRRYGCNQQCPEKKIAAQTLCHHAGDIGTQPVEYCLPERQQAGCAEQDIERKGKQAENDNLRRNVDGVISADEDHAAENQKIGQPWGHGSKFVVHIFFLPFSRENSPFGLKISTTIITAKLSREAHWGIQRIPNALTSPISSAANSAPQKFPSPPMTTTISESIMTSTPVPGATVRSGAAMAPARPPIAVATPNTRLMTSETFTPSIPTICVSVDAA